MRINMGLYKILRELDVPEDEATAAAALDDITATEKTVERIRTEVAYHRWIIGALVALAIERVFNLFQR